MNSKVVVKGALNFDNPEILPYGEYAIDFDVIEKILGRETYLRAKAKSKLALWSGRRKEVVESWKEDTVELYSKFDCIDIVNLAAEASGLAPPKNYKPKNPRKLDEKTWKDHQGRIYKYSDKTEDISLIEDPTQSNKENIEDYIESFREPDESCFEVIDYVISRLGEEKFIIGPAGREVGMVLLGGMEEGLIKYVESPKLVKKVAEREVEIGNKEDHYFIREGLDAIMWGQDFSYNKGSFISPKTFKDFVLPYIKMRVSNIKDNFDLPIIKHACGNNWQLLDYFIEAGYDCYQSIQATAGMDIKKLADLYGDVLCMWGGYNYEDLISGCEEKLRKDIKTSYKVAQKHGGFILGSSHSVGIGTKYDNFMTVLDEVSKLKNIV